MTANSSPEAAGCWSTEEVCCSREVQFALRVCGLRRSIQPRGEEEEAVYSEAAQSDSSCFSKKGYASLRPDPAEPQGSHSWSHDLKELSLSATMEKTGVMRMESGRN